MDYELRVSKIEAQLETNQKEFERLHQAISELRKLILERSAHFELSIAELRQHADHRFEEERKYIDHRFEEERKYTDQRFAELRLLFEEERKHTDHRFGEIRREIAANLRWTVAMWLTTIGFVAGMSGRVFGLY